MKVFLSYSSTHRAQVIELEKDIEALGHDVWFDQELLGGQEWWRAICQNIRSCDVMIFAVSPESLESEPCRLEYTYAHDLGKTIVPLVIYPTDLHGLPEILDSIQMIDFTDPADRAAHRRLSMALREAETILANNPPQPNGSVPPPEMPYVALEAIREALESDDLPSSMQDRLYKVLTRNFIKTDTSVTEARELLLKMAAHPAVPDDRREACYAVLFEAMDGLQYGLEHNPTLPEPRLMQIVEGYERYLDDLETYPAAREQVMSIKQRADATEAVQGAIDELLYLQLRQIETVLKPRHELPEALQHRLVDSLLTYENDRQNREKAYKLLLSLALKPNTSKVVYDAQKNFKYQPQREKARAKVLRTGTRQAWQQWHNTKSYWMYPRHWVGLFWLVVSGITAGAIGLLVMTHWSGGHTVTAPAYVEWVLAGQAILVGAFFSLLWWAEMRLAYPIWQVLITLLGGMLVAVLVTVGGLLLPPAFQPGMVFGCVAGALVGLPGGAFFMGGRNSEYGILAKLDEEAWWLLGVAVLVVAVLGGLLLLMAEGWRVGLAFALTGALMTASMAGVGMSIMAALVVLEYTDEAKKAYANLPQEQANE